MSDGSSRFSRSGAKIHHYMGTSTFSNYRPAGDRGGEDPRGRAVRLHFLGRVCHASAIGLDTISRYLSITGSRVSQL
jgi:hypothetical protein